MSDIEEKAVNQTGEGSPEESDAGKIAEFIRAEQAKRTAAESASEESDEPTEEESDEEIDEASDLDEEAEEEGADDESELEDDEGEDEEESPRFTEEDFAKPGFFDSLDADGWKALEKEYPGVVRLQKAIQADATRRYNAVSKRERELQEKESNLTQAARPPQAEEDLPTDEELEQLGYSPNDVKAFLASKTGQELITGMVDRQLKAKGIDPDRDRAVQDAAGEGFSSAAEKFPELAQDDFWSETVKQIESDPELAMEVGRSTDPKFISAVIRAAAAEVRAARSTKPTESKPVDDEARRKRLQRETATAKKKKASKAPGSSKKPALKPGEEVSAAEFIRQKAQEKNYTVGS